MPRDEVQRVEVRICDGCLMYAGLCEVTISFYRILGRDNGFGVFPRLSKILISIEFLI